ncbi:DEAD/DEAH box helicase [Synechococcus sp. PCC 7336]|uniref:DEAD/DEAH box helicase n=1 Tax=Synechococcus sp. PCC 7336 TaxID=195250 RepID=UPI00034D71B1|nr:DEAD/DEAH box helicase [Synechococcus sp. PCC 7336]
MSKGKFQNYDPLNPNTAERKLWECLKKTFQNDPCVVYFRYPIFKRTGNLNREPDVIFMHRELGLWVLECKGCRIANIKSIEGHQWKMNSWHREEELPILQAQDGMYAISAKLNERRETRSLVSSHYRVVLPFVKAQEWKDKGFSDLPCTHGVILLEDDLKSSVLREKLQLGSQEHPQPPLSDDQWQNIITLLGGSLPKQEPRAIPTGTPPENPVRVIKDLESRLHFLDNQQQKVAFEVPDGPQRVRGLAGTGKTVLFAKRAAKIHAAHPEWKIAFVFFTRALYDQIICLISLYYREMVRQDEGDVEPDWHTLQVLHAWGAQERNGFYRNLAQKSGIRPMSVNNVKQSLGRSCSPSEAFEYICNSLEKQVENIPVLFDAILIDEGQDLPPSFYRLAYKSLSDPRRLYWAYDEAQGIGTLTVPRPLQIFGLNSDNKPVVDLGGNKLPDGTITSPTYKGGHRKAHNLNRCYRIPKMILMAAHAINMGLLRQEGCLQGVSNKGDWEALGYTVLDGDFSDASVKAGKTVTITREIENSPHPIDNDDFSPKDALGSPLLIQTFSDESEEQEWVAEQIEKDLKLGFDPWDLMITCPTGDKEKQYFEAMKDKLSRRGVRSIIAGVDTEKDIFREDKCVTIATISRSKGNESWKVYACRFHCSTQPIDWKGESELQKRNEAFVALTRARVWCVVTGVDGVSSIFEELRSIIQQYPDVTFKSFNKSSLKRINDEDLE